MKQNMINVAKTTIVSEKHVSSSETMVFIVQMLSAELVQGEGVCSE